MLKNKAYKKGEMFMWEFWLGYWWAVLVYGLAFGFVTKIVIKNKGYPEGKWFWWGFFFGVFALIVACTKPANVNASGQVPAVANSPLPQAVGLEKDYDTLYAIPERQYSNGTLQLCYSLSVPSFVFLLDLEGQRLYNKHTPD